MQKKASAKGRSPPQELEEGPHSGPHLLWCLRGQKQIISYIRKGKYNPAPPPAAPPVYVTLRGPPLYSEMGWTGELWSNCLFLILEGAARYAGLLLAPAEGFGLRPRPFFALRAKKDLFMSVLAHNLKFLVISSNLSKF